MTNPILLAEEADEQEIFAAYDPSVTPMYQSDAVGETRIGCWTTVLIRAS